MLPATAAMVLLFCLACACSGKKSTPVAPLAGESFRFTVSADNRSENEEFRHLLGQIKTQVKGVGEFHISVGDMDPVERTYQNLVDIFGKDVLWYPVVGNHEIGEDPNLSWLREYNKRLPHVVNGGPLRDERTTYSFDHGNAHFVVLNEYYDGKGPTGADGDVVPELLAWLDADLKVNRKPFVFVFGHEPAFPKYRHTADSLNAYPENRDRFWKLLADRGVAAYFCGHSHHYYATEVASNGGRSVWQIDVGNAGRAPSGEAMTFMDVSVFDKAVQFTAWRGESGEFSPIESWSFRLVAD